MRDSIEWGTRIERLMLDGYGDSDLTVLRDLPSLTGLRLDRPERLRCLRGVSPRLERLSAAAARASFGS